MFQTTNQYIIDYDSQISEELFLGISRFLSGFPTKMEALAL